MSNESAKEWTLRELAGETGVPERTIRFYISRGLVDPPLRGGRGAAYGEKHKSRLAAIRELQAKGMMLAEIRHVLETERAEGPALHSSGTGDEMHDKMLWFEPDGSLAEGSKAMISSQPESKPAPALPEPETWRKYSLAPDIVVSLRTGGSPWRTKSLLAALRRFAEQIATTHQKEDKGE